MKKALAVLIDSLNSRVDLLDDRLSAIEKLVSSIHGEVLEDDGLRTRHVRNIPNGSHVSVIG